MKKIPNCRFSTLYLTLVCFLLFGGCDSLNAERQGAPNDGVRHIKILTQDGKSIVFELNGSSAAQSLYEQLPLTITVQNYAADEKIFYPPHKLNTAQTPLAKGPAGTLAYYAPWGNVAIFYGNCGGAGGLYALGKAISGAEYIAGLTGEINVQKLE